MCSRASINTIACTLLGLLLLVACGSNVPVAELEPQQDPVPAHSFSAVAGDYTVPGDVDTAILLGFNASQASKPEGNAFTLKTPSGLEQTYSLRWPANFQGYIVLFTDTANAGTYTVTGEVDGQSLTVSSDKSMNFVVGTALQPNVTLATPNRLTASWQKAYRAKSYAVALVSSGGQVIRSGFTKATQLDWTGLSLSSSEGYYLLVRPSSADLTLEPALMPKRFAMFLNISAPILVGP